jgi:hypothetical protein
MIQRDDFLFYTRIRAADAIVFARSFSNRLDLYPTPRHPGANARSANAPDLSFNRVFTTLQRRRRRKRGAAHA